MVKKEDYFGRNELPNIDVEGLPFQLFVIGEPVGSMKGVPKHTTCARFIFDTSAMGELFLYVEKPAPSEIKAVQSGKITLGMTKHKGLLFLTWQFGDKDLIMETPYNFHLRGNDFVFQIPKEGQGYGINVILVDSSNGIIKALRMFGTSKEWSDDFRNECLVQQKENFDPVAYDNALQLSYKERDISDLSNIGKTYDIKWKKL
jgi:hypothetical protein